MRVLMFPFSSLAGAFPKMIRDLARDKGKEADLEIIGGEVEVDKRILERMKDPIIHLLRNCVDHGIEGPEEREGLGKPRRGAVTLVASESEGDKVEIVVSDDGAGIDPDAIRKAAVTKLGLSDEEARALDTDDTRSLIFRSGLSTSPMITDISGRGLGLAIVQEAGGGSRGQARAVVRARQGGAFHHRVAPDPGHFPGHAHSSGRAGFCRPHGQRGAGGAHQDRRYPHGRESGGHLVWPAALRPGQAGFGPGDRRGPPGRPGIGRGHGRLGAGLRQPAHGPGRGSGHGRTGRAGQGTGQAPFRAAQHLRGNGCWGPDRWCRC